MNKHANVHRYIERLLEDCHMALDDGQPPNVSLYRCIGWADYEEELLFCGIPTDTDGTYESPHQALIQRVTELVDQLALIHFRPTNTITRQMLDDIAKLNDSLSGCTNE